jgi:phosphoribosylaminoimidazole-succinocarboxamide synthase
MKLSSLYVGSVKEVLGPLELLGESAVVFRFTDAYSVFDWGRMPDAIPHKGEALALMAAYFFERLEDAGAWCEFSSSSQAQALRKGISQLRTEVPYPERDSVPDSLSARFNEEGECLKRTGLRTHYRGIVSALEPWQTKRISALSLPASSIVVREVRVIQPLLRPVMGRAVLDYHLTRSTVAPRLVPLEVVFRWSSPRGSSLPSVAERDPEYWRSLILPKDQSVPSVGDSFAFPVVELFTKLESTDRRVTLTEALAISGISSEQLEQILIRTFWISGFLKWEFASRGITLEDGKLEWGVGERGEVFLVDALGPDELRLQVHGQALSKETIRAHYRKTPWYDAVLEAKATGDADWKRKVSLSPQVLPQELRRSLGQMYCALTEKVLGRNFWPKTQSLEQVAEILARFER